MWGKRVNSSNRPWKDLRAKENVPFEQDPVLFIELLSEALMDGAVFPSVSRKM